MISSLANFPHVTDKIKLFWGDVELFDAYMKSILIADRENRTGFSPLIFSDLLAIQRAHQILFSV